MKRFFQNTKFTLAVSICTILGTAAAADTVTLTERQGKVSVFGTLLSYDGEFYRIRTSLGDLKLQASQSICTGEGCPSILTETTDLKIAGSGTVTEQLIPQLAQAYFGEFSAETMRDDDTGGMTYFEFDRLNNSDLMMTLVHSNSGSGLSELMNGDLHAAFTTRTATVGEELIAAERGLSPLREESQESVIAHDGLLVVTHPSNPIQAMTEMDIASVFSGTVTDWSSFGHSPGVINVYVREADSNARSLLQEVLMSPHRKALATQINIRESDAEIAAAVRADPNGIGLTSFVNRAGVNALEIEGICGIRVPATRFTIKTGEYPLSRPIYFYHNAGIAHEGLRGFSEFIASPDAQPMIHAAGFVGREITSEPLNSQGLRVTNAIIGEGAAENMEGTRAMLRLMSYANRLSTTIRFDNGSTDLDATDYQDLELLAELIRSPDYAGADFYFMGFSDSIGRADLNQYVALQRAEIVRQALVSRHPDLADRIIARSVGYGELSPLACNETRPGRKVNRRVEVWVQKPLTVAER